MKKLWLWCVVFSACGGVGQVSLTTWGEDFIEQEIPATLFEDGFSVRYSKFLEGECGVQTPPFPFKLRA